MVAYFQNPLNIFITAMAVAFLLGVTHKIAKSLSTSLFYLGLLAVAAISIMSTLSFQSALNITTAGFNAPIAINLLFGPYEAFFVMAVNFAAFFGGVYLYDYLKSSVLGRILYLMLFMGINGMIMTRDLFNLFIFIEITSISTYGLIALEKNIKSLSAGFKYILAGAMLSTFFLLGTALIYYQTGTLNIDQIINMKATISGPIGGVALSLLMAALIIELKPFPVNGWGLDVYQGSTPGVGAVISIGVSTGALFALFKLIPLFPATQMGVLTIIGLVTFFFSNLMGIKQTDAKRMLGYSSIGQMGLIVVALSYFHNAPMAIFMSVVGGLFLNHFFAKAALFWIAGIVGEDNYKNWGILKNSYPLLVVFVIAILALVGLPPFPGFWSKWRLVMFIGETGNFLLVAVILLGSLFEGVYLFRWFGSIVGSKTEQRVGIQLTKHVPVLAFGIVLVTLSYLLMQNLLIPNSNIFVLPFVVSAAFLALSFLPGKLRGVIALALIAYLSYYYQSVEMTLLGRIFVQIFLWGGAIILFSTLYKKKHKPATYGLLLMLLTSLSALVLSKTNLQFFFNWEIMTISSYLLVTMGKNAKKSALTYIIFSLGSAAFLMAGFALSGVHDLASLATIGSKTTLVFSLMSIGFLIKLGAFGFHIWVPGAYAESEDDFSTVISALLSKAGIFGLFLIAIYMQKEITGSTLAYTLGWVGVLTATFGALMATFQEDVKKLLAYSSMGQIGYIITGVALMSHLGWVAALYLTINHVLYKGLLFIVIAGVIYRVGTREMYKMGGLIKKMPLSFISAMIAIIAMSGVPPLTGFGGKWLIYESLLEQGWVFQATLAFFASGIAFLYMYRLLHTIFLGQLKAKHKEIKEAPLWITIPQVIFIALIMGASIFPKAWITVLSKAVSDYIPSTISWTGNTASTSLGYWNGFMVMNIVGVVFIVCLIWLMLARMKLQKVEQFNIVFAGERPFKPETTHVAHNMYAPYQKALGSWVTPRATHFWGEVTEWSHTLAHTFRQIYTGNGQTYAFFILLYFLMIYLLIGGAR